MYCSTCGVAVTKGLSYCNYCGSKLIGAGDGIESPGVRPELLVSAMAGVFVLGLGAIAILIGVMKQVGAFDLPILLAITMFCFLLLLVIEAVFIWLLLKGKKGVKQVGDAEPPNKQKSRELEKSEARMLPEHVPTVTEHTTRAFDPIYSERPLK